MTVPRSEYGLKRCDWSASVEAAARSVLTGGRPDFLRIVQLRGTGRMGDSALAWRRAVKKVCGRSPSRRRRGPRIKSRTGTENKFNKEIYVCVVVAR